MYDIYDQPFIVIDNGIAFAKLNNISIKNEDILKEYIENRVNYINIKISIVNPSLTSPVNSVYSLYFVKK
jgi:hypothetical protein